MQQSEIDAALLEFDHAIGVAAHTDGGWQALQTLTTRLVGVKLFTVMTVDPTGTLNRRAFTSHPQAYPVSGTKPIHRDAWYAIVHERREPFVANNLAEIAKVFPDYETIGVLGCASVINLPVVLGDVMVGSINLLDAEGAYPPARVALTRHLSLPAKAAFLLALAR